MEKDYRNLYRIPRKIAGLTQERWAEALDISVDSVQIYESDRAIPSDEVVTRMVEVAGYPVLGYWHLLKKSRVAAELLPDVPELPLAQAVIRLLNQIRAFETRRRCDELMNIAGDGRVDELEAAGFGEILEDLDGIVQAAICLRYAKEDKDGP